MEFNICRYCGANNGRAGVLINSPDLGIDYACSNCYDTLKNGEIHSTGTYNKSDKHGIFEWYNSDGKLIKRVVYKNDEQEDVQYYGLIQENLC